MPVAVLSICPIPRDFSKSLYSYTGMSDEFLFCHWFWEDMYIWKKLSLPSLCIVFQKYIIFPCSRYPILCLFLSLKPLIIVKMQSTSKRWLYRYADVTRSATWGNGHGSLPHAFISPPTTESPLMVESHLGQIDTSCWYASNLDPRMQVRIKTVLTRQMEAATPFQSRLFSAVYITHRQ